MRRSRGSWHQSRIFLCVAACAVAAASSRSARAQEKEAESTTPPPTVTTKKASAKDAVEEPKKGDAMAGRWGDVAFSFVERFGRMSVPSDSERGTSGMLQGSGVELRFMMRAGVGAYYRWTNAATNTGNKQDWYHLEYAFGFARRLHATGKSDLIGLRTSSRIELGFLYTQLGTHEACSRSYVPLATDCSTTNYAPGNASGAGVGLEMRLGGDIAFGPLDLGLDIGISGYRRWSTGSGSVSIPGWFYVPSAQLKLAIALPFT
ncbi:MAG: hypothetical protein ABI175_02370 [Polyangiales bacterium]